ncbi:Gfo/Idh/MocA family oxidoreductase [Pseudonocardia zijingensis]|uniref:Gfo/Idh/MocA family oxidoreductase n=1 Tax=Pseudonocardia zijingensis TaxID=153376 RepID=A0ABN1PTS3_9PSEU
MIPIKTTLRVGVVGAGGIANAHLPAWLHLGADVRVHSLHGAPELVERHGGGQVACSLDELLAGVDVVDVCTPTFAHPEIVLAAAAAGRHVVCEKPLALDPDTAESMVAACAAAGVQLYPGHVVRFFPEYAAMQRAVADGAIGTPAVLTFHRCGSRPLRGWFADPALSGGIIMDQMIHDLDFARWLGGEVDSVHARLSDSAPGTATGVVSAHVTARHRNGVISNVTGTWARPGTRFRYGFRVAGTDGLLAYDSADDPSLRTDTGAPDAGGERLLPDVSLVESPFIAELGEFAAAFAGGPPPRVDAADGVAAVRLAAAANASLASGRPEAVELAGVPA